MKKTDGFSVDLKKEIFFVLRRWKFILASMLLFGALAGGLKYYLDKNEYKSQKDKTVEEVSLSDDELDEVSYAVMYKEQMDGLKEYLNSSIYVNLDYTNVTETRITYVIELKDDELSFEEKQEEIASLCEIYSLYVGGEAILNDIEAENVYGIENKYISEMIIISEYSNDEYIDKINVYVINDEKLNGLTDKIKENIGSYCTELNKNGYKHELKLIEDVTYETVDNKVLSASQGLQSDIYTTNTRYQKAVNDLTNNQKILYDKIISGEAVDMEDLFVQKNVKVGKPHVDIIFVIAGVLIGFVIACGLLILKFSLTDKIMSDKDFDGLFALKYLGLIFDDKYAEEKKKSIFDRLEYSDLLNAEYKEKLNFVAVKLKLMCDKKDISKVAIISSDYANLSDEIISDLRIRMQSENIELIRLDNVLTDSKEMGNLFELGVCIFAESTNKTKIKKMSQLVELCEENNIVKLGVVEINV